MAMAMAMADVASVIGVSPAVFQFLVAFIGSIPCSLLWRFIPSPSLRHCYAALSGCYLSYLAFSPLSVIHFIPPMLLGYGSMAYARQYCGLFTFVAAFSFLIAWYVSLSLPLSLSPSVYIPLNIFFFLSWIMSDIFSLPFSFSNLFFCFCSFFRLYLCSHPCICSLFLREFAHSLSLFYTLIFCLDLRIFSFSQPVSTPLHAFHVFKSPRFPFSVGNSQFF